MIRRMIRICLLLLLCVVSLRASAEISTDSMNNTDASGAYVLTVPSSPTKRYLRDVPSTAVSITASPYGANVANADNAANIQAAINAAVAANVPLLIPAATSCYKYTPPLTISGNLRVMGDWVAENWGTANNSINVPTGSPALLGSVLCPSSNGSDAIDISGVALTVNFTNIGIMWQSAGAYNNTGDGINYTPATIAGGWKQGLSGALWENVKVWGHDGNHYAVNLTNPIYNTMIDVFGYGGGGLNMQGGATSLDYGNTVLVHPYFQTYVGGSSHCINLTANRTTALNLLTFVRPQCIVEPINSLSPAPPSAPTNAQDVFNQDTNTRSVTMVAPDFEASGSLSGGNGVVNLQSNQTNLYDFNQTMWLGANHITVTINGTPIKSAHLPGPYIIQYSSFNGLATGGTITFDQAFPNAAFAVVCTGWGHTVNLTAAPTTTGFSYNQTADGQSYCIAMGY